MRTASVAIVGLGLVLGCGGGGGGGSVDAAADADVGPPDPQFTDPANQVTVREAKWNQDTTAGQVDARFSVGATGMHGEAMRAGNCRLLTSDAEYCQGTPCSGWCVDDVCHEWPTFRDAGHITTSGLSGSVGLTFNTGYYAPDSFPVPADLFDPGDAISVTAAGAEFPGFTVGAIGVDTMAPDLTGTCENEWHIARGGDADLHWDTAGDGARVHLWVPSPNRGHGLPSTAVIECEGPDTGGFHIASALIDGMPDFAQIDGCSGIACVSIDCPPATIERYTTGTTTAGGEDVELRVSSETTFYVYD